MSNQLSLLDFGLEFKVELDIPFRLFKYNRYVLFAINRCGGAGNNYLFKYKDYVLVVSMFYDKELKKSFIRFVSFHYKNNYKF